MSQHHRLARHHRWLALPIVAAMLAACGDGEDAAAQDGPVDLRMTIWTASEDHLALFEEIADAYVADHGDTVSSVEFETIPFEDYTTALTTQIAGGNPPDLAWIFESTAPSFVESGALLPLTEPLEAAEGYEYDDLSDSALALWKKDDDLYAYPFSTSPFAVFVNTDMLAEAGQPVPADLYASGEWTWDAVRDMGAAVHEETGDTGFIIRDFNYSTWENLAALWNGWGAQAWSDDYTTCTLAEPEMVDAVTFFHDAAFADGATLTPGNSADFFAGEAAMTVTQISRASLLDDSFGWDLLPLPAGPEGSVGVIGQAGIGVFADSQAPDAAADFLAWFTNPENTRKLAQFFPPPRESLLTADVLAEANPKLSKDQLQTAVVESVPGAVTKPSHPNFAEIQQAVRAELDALWTADADVAGVLGAACERIAPLMEQ